MNDLLAKAGAAFLAPAPAGAPALPAADAPPPDMVGVLAPSRDLPAVCGGIAAELRRRHHVRAALVCAPGRAPARPAGRAARTMAGRMTSRELAATAAGGVCRVALPPDPEVAVREAWRAITAAAGYPAVIAFAERTEAADGLLADADLLVLALPAATAVTELALAALESLGPPAILVPPPTSLVTRRLAALSLVSVPLRAGVPA